MANELTDATQQILPNVSGIGNFVGYLIGLFFLLIVLGTVAFFVVRRMRFNQKVVIFQKIGGRFEPTIRTRARFIRYGDAGDRVFYIAKLKRSEPVPELQTGRNTWWFFQRQDGELINFTPEDFDEKSKLLGAKFLDKEMRYARVSLQHDFKDRYDKKSFLEKYGLVLAGGFFLIILLIFIYLAADKVFGSLGQIDKLLETANTIGDKQIQILNAMNNICQGGTGLKPAS